MNHKRGRLGLIMLSVHCSSPALAADPHASAGSLRVSSTIWTPRGPSAGDGTVCQEVRRLFPETTLEQAFRHECTVRFGERFALNSLRHHTACKADLNIRAARDSDSNSNTWTVREGTIQTHCPSATSPEERYDVEGDLTIRFDKPAQGKDASERWGTLERFRLALVGVPVAAASIPSDLEEPLPIVLVREIDGWRGFLALVFPASFHEIPCELAVILPVHASTDLGALTLTARDAPIARLYLDTVGVQRGRLSLVPKKAHEDADTLTLEGPPGARVRVFGAATRDATAEPLLGLDPWYLQHKSMIQCFDGTTDSAGRISWELAKDPPFPKHLGALQAVLMTEDGPRLTNAIDVPGDKSGR